jgi:hypothetical protein
MNVIATETMIITNGSQLQMLLSIQVEEASTNLTTDTSATGSAK